MNHDVFISYSSKDKAVADAVCHVIEQHDMQCWIAPRDVNPGARYAAEIVNGIKHCRVMVLVYSKESNQSEHVANEVDRAFNEGKTIIPFLVDDTPMNDEFDYYLARKHWLVAYPHYAEQLENLAKAIANVLGVEFKELSFKTEIQPNIDCQNNDNLDTTTVDPILPVEAEIHFEVDADCDLLLFKKKIATLRANEDNAIHLKPGTYKLEFVSCKYPDINKSITYNLAQGVFTDLIVIKILCCILEHPEERLKLEWLKIIKLKCYKQNSKWGFVDEEGNVVIPCKWKKVRSFEEELAGVQNDEDRWGFINKAGIEIIPCIWRNVWDFKEGLAHVVNENWQEGFIDKNGEAIIPCIWDKAGEFHDGLSLVKLDGKHSYIDKTGTVVISSKWDYCCRFYDGLALVKKGDKWGYIDKTGTEIIPCKWENADRFAEGLARVMINGKWGYIDKNGHEVIPLKFKYAENFKDGIAWVGDNDDNTLFRIDKMGKRKE